ALFLRGYERLWRCWQRKSRSARWEFFSCSCSAVWATITNDGQTEFEGFLHMPLLTIILAFLFVIVGWYEDLKVIARSQLDGTMRFRSKQRGHWEEHPDTPGVVIRNVEELLAACYLKERRARLTGKPKWWWPSTSV